MSIVTLSLPESLDRFVDDQVASGAYPDAPALIRAALERLREDQAEEAVRTARLNAMLQAGLDDFDAGRFEIVDDIPAWLAERGRR